MHIIQATWMVHTLGSKESRPSGATHLAAPTKNKHTHTHTHTRTSDGSTSQTQRIWNSKQSSPKYSDLQEAVVVWFEIPECPRV